MIRPFLSKLGAVLLGMLPLAALAQPANDDCAGAIELFPSGTCTPVAGTVAGATQSLPGTVSCDGFDATPDDDVWYRFTATAAEHQIRVQGSPQFDAVIQLLSGACDGTPIVCRDVISAGGLEVLQATGLTVGGEYLVRVFHWAATPPATPDFTICITTVEPPANDDCAGAVELIPTPACNPVAGTTANATQSLPGTVSCDGFAATPDDDVWYRFTATATEHTITVAGQPQFDAVIQLLSGACPGTPIICRDLISAGGSEVLEATGLTVGGEYLVRVFHWAATPAATPGFTICLQGPEPSGCAADASTLSPNRPEVCFEDGPTAIEAAFDSPPTVPPGFEVMNLLVTGPEQTIMATSAFPNFQVDAIGDYAILTLVYDPATFDPGTIALGVTTAGSIDAQLIQGGGTICGSLDLAGAQIQVIVCADCLAEAGTLTADAATVCFDADLNLAEISATPDGNAVVPPGFELVYLLTHGGHTIVDRSMNPFFAVDATGDYTMHAFVYDPATFDFGMVVLGTTTLDEVADHIAANSLCASLDAAGTPIEVAVCPDCPAEAGTLTAIEPTVCFDADLNQAAIGATPDGNAVVPPGFAVVYLLSTGPSATFVNRDLNPAFTVSVTGTYAIHALVFDPATLDLGQIALGTTTVDDLLDIIAANSLCASLDAAGAPIAVEVCPDCTAEAGTLTADEPTVCFDMDLNQAAIGATADGNAVVPPGFELAYLLTEGPGAVIVDAGTSPAFTVFATGSYAIHALVHDPATLDLGDITLGADDLADLQDLIIANSLCASIDPAGAPITVQYCILCDAEAGTLLIDQSPVCLVMGAAQVGATHDVQPTVPSGYEVAYLLAKEPGLIIMDQGPGPVFDVADAGSYRIHALVYDPATLDPATLDLGTTTVFEVEAILAQGGGAICGALDMAGAQVIVEDCAPANNDCINAQPLGINAAGDCPAHAVAGDNSYATMDGWVPSCEDPGSYLADVWYTFNADANTEVTLHFGSGAMSDWAIAIYDGCGGNEVACYITPDEPIVIPTTPFTDYVVQVYTNTDFGDGAPFTICLTGDVPTDICDGGLVQTTDGLFTMDVCQDTDPDVISFTTTSTSPVDYVYMVTDDNDVIIAALAGGSLDFNSAPVGLYRVWGVAFSGTLSGGPGDLITELTATGGCLDLSDNYVLVDVSICSGVADAASGRWSLFPNPGTGDFSLVAPMDGPVRVEVMDLGGRVVHAQDAIMAKGAPMPFALRGKLAAGTYTVRLLSPAQAASLRLVVR